MQKITLEIKGKTYEKDEPTVQDWLDHLEISPKLEKGMVDVDSTSAYMEVVAKYLCAPIEQVSTCALKEIVSAYRAIHANMIECFGSESDDKKK